MYLKGTMATVVLGLRTRHPKIVHPQCSSLAYFQLVYPENLQIGGALKIFFFTDKRNELLVITCIRKEDAPDDFMPGEDTEPDSLYASHISRFTFP